MTKNKIVKYFFKKVPNEGPNLPSEDARLSFQSQNSEAGEFSRLWNIIVVSNFVRQLLLPLVGVLVSDFLLVYV
jgi:hypothetical protein